MVHARNDYNRIQDPDGLIPNDEPVFLVRAQDCFGALTVRYWAQLAEKAGASPAIIDKALAHADLMEKWAKKVGL